MDTDLTTALFAAPSIVAEPPDADGSLLFRSAESLGGYPGSMHGMPRCCDAMQDEIKPGDMLVIERASGAGMTVRYLLPRAG